MYAIQRGNCIFYAIVFMLLFILGYRSEKKWIRYASYVCLAIATGIKLYPALLAILILREREIKEFLICVGLVAGVFLVSFLFTDGDPISFLDNLFSFSSPHDTSRSRIGIREWFAAFGLYFFDDNLNYIGLPVTLFFLAGSLLLIVFDREMPLWQAITLLGCNMAIGVGVSTTYGFLYLLPGFIFFITQYERWDRPTQIITVLFALIFALVPSVPMIKSFCTFGIMLIILYSSIKHLKESRGLKTNQSTAPQA
ncbi:hypothetical protein TALC_00084 [Thermoplasmatales archaeon BRNA1]|nr:hypothetical protein TALC_00084 [Thermoplasmatales archaeon BRNA1]